MEYIVIIAVGALFATILLNAIQSETIQAAVIEKVRCFILFSGEGCKDPQSASENVKPTVNNYPPDEHKNPDSPPIPPVPPQPQVQVTSQEQDLIEPWYKCLFSLYCLKKNAGEAVDEIKSFFVRYMEDLEKEALQHCGQDAECISKYKLKKGFSLALHLQPGLGLPSLAIEKLTGWSFLDTVADYTVEHPFEALATVLFLVSIPFTGGDRSGRSRRGRSDGKCTRRSGSGGDCLSGSSAKYTFFSQGFQGGWYAASLFHAGSPVFSPSAWKAGLLHRRSRVGLIGFETAR